MNDRTARFINWGNALFACQPKRITRQILIKAYEAGHAGLISSLKRVREADFERSAFYPEAFVSELAGVVTIERLFRYMTLHFDVHAGQIHSVIAPSRAKPSMERGAYAEAPE